MDKNKIVAELVAERNRLNRAIAALVGDDNPDAMPDEQAPKPTAKRQRKHHELTAEAKQAVSARMKRYWAQRKGNQQQ